MWVGIDCEFHGPAHPFSSHPATIQLAVRRASAAGPADKAAVGPADGAAGVADGDAGPADGTAGVAGTTGGAVRAWVVDCLAAPPGTEAGNELLCLLALVLPLVRRPGPPPHPPPPLPRLGANAPGGAAHTGAERGPCFFEATRDWKAAAADGTKGQAGTGPRPAFVAVGFAFAADAAKLDALLEALRGGPPASPPAAATATGATRGAPGGPAVAPAPGTGRGLESGAAAAVAGAGRVDLGQVLDLQVCARPQAHAQNTHTHTNSVERHSHCCRLYTPFGMHVLYSAVESGPNSRDWHRTLVALPADCGRSALDAQPSAAGEKRNLRR